MTSRRSRDQASQIRRSSRRDRKHHRQLPALRFHTPTLPSPQAGRVREGLPRRVRLPPLAPVRVTIVAAARRSQRAICTMPDEVTPRSLRSLASLRQYSASTALSRNAGSFAASRGCGARLRYPRSASPLRSFYLIEIVAPRRDRAELQAFPFEKMVLCKILSYGKRNLRYYEPSQGPRLNPRPAGTWSP